MSQVGGEGTDRGHSGFVMTGFTRDIKRWVDYEGSWLLESDCSGADHPVHLIRSSVPGSQFARLCSEGYVLGGKAHLLSRSESGSS